MAAPARKSSSIITHRARATIALPPMILGYDNLIDPERFDPDKPKLTMNGHLTPQGIEALKETVRTKVYTEAALEALIAECEENKLKLPTKEPKDPAAWLGGKLREPKEGFAIQLPYIKLENNLLYSKKNRDTGEREQVERQISAWDGHNHKLNLKRLLLGRGSVVEPVVFGNLFFSKVIGVIQPSLKLVGVRVIELVQFQKGGSNAPAEADEQSIRDVLGRDIKSADLSAFMGEEPDEDEEPEDREHGAPDADQSPEERAKGMF